MPLPHQPGIHARRTPEEQRGRKQQKRRSGQDGQKNADYPKSQRYESERKTDILHTGKDTMIRWKILNNANLCH